MRRTSRVSHRAPKRRESKTECGRGALPLMDWQKFPRLRCRPSRSSSRQTTRADGAVLILSSCRAKSRHPAKSPRSEATGFLDFARNDNGVSGGQLVNLKFRGRFDRHRVPPQVCGKHCIRMQPPESILVKTKWVAPRRRKLSEILDCPLSSGLLLRTASFSNQFADSRNEIHFAKNCARLPQYRLAAHCSDRRKAG